MGKNSVPIAASAHHLSTGALKLLHWLHKVDILHVMENSSHPTDAQDALARVKAAIGRIENAATKIVEMPAPSPSVSESSGASSAKVTALVNKHEAMREEVAVTMRELDSIISKLEI